MSKDIFSNTLGAIAYNLQTVSSAGDKNGNAINMDNYESGKIILAVGAVTAGTIVLKEILEGDESDVSDGTAIPSDRLFGTITALDTANTTNEIGFYHAKRYIKPVFTASTSANLVAGSIVEKGCPHVAPVQS